MKYHVIKDNDPWELRKQMKWAFSLSLPTAWRSYRPCCRWGKPRRTLSVSPTKWDRTGTPESTKRQSSQGKGPEKRWIRENRLWRSVEDLDPSNLQLRSDQLMHVRKLFKTSKTNTPKFRGNIPHNSVRVRNSFICTKLENFIIHG